MSVHADHIGSLLRLRSCSARATPTRAGSSTRWSSSARRTPATQYIPVERLGISPQCGFASTAPGNLITWDDQKRKLELVVSVAEEVWGS